MKKKLNKKNALEAAFINWEDAVTSNTKEDTYYKNATSPYSEKVGELYCANWRNSDALEISELDFVDKCQLAAQLGCELAGLC